MYNLLYFIYMLSLRSSRSRHKLTNGQTTSSAKKKRQGSANKSSGGKSGQVSQNKSVKNMSKNNSINRKRKKPILESPTKNKKFKPNKSQRKNRRKPRERTLINITLAPESFACSTPFRTIIGDTPEFEQATPIHTEALPQQQYSDIVSTENFTEGKYNIIIPLSASLQKFFLVTNCELLLLTFFFKRKIFFISYK